MTDRLRETADAHQPDLWALIKKPAAIVIGMALRVYLDDERFLDGKVEQIGPDGIYVDFHDWIQFWQVGELEFQIKEWRYVLVALTKGREIMRFGELPQSQSD